MRKPFLLVLLMLSFSAHAGPRDLVVLQPGAPATEEEAAPYVELLLDYLKTKLGGQSFSGSFFGELAPGLAHIAKVRPAYGFVSVGFYQAHGKAMGMVPLAQIVAGGKRARPYSVVVRKGAYASLEQLKGKKLAGGILFEPELFFDLGLGGAFKAKDFELIPTTRSLRYLRRVAKGRVDGMILDARAVDGLSKLKLPAELTVIHQTAPIPHPVFVAFDAVAPRAERDRMRAALLALCSDEAGKKVCENFDFGSFARVDAKDLPQPK